MSNARKQAQDDARRFINAKLFIATVDSVSGGLIKIQRLGQAAADAQFYPAAAGLAAAVSAGHLVVCAALPSGVIVICRFVVS